MVTKRKAPFKAKYGVELGLCVRDRDPETQEVLTASCLFCELFGRESKPGASRRATDKVAIFKIPFRKDSIQIHHTGQHAARWAEYCALSSHDSKRAFFIAAGATMDLSMSREDSGRPRKTARVVMGTSHSTNVISGTSMSSVVGSNLSSLTNGLKMHWLVNRDIASVVVGVMLPYAAAPTPAGQTYQLQAVADFEDMMDPVEVRTGTGMDAVLARYRAVVHDPTQFQQFVEYLSTSGSLTSTARMLHAISRSGQLFNEEETMPSVNVAKYARYLCAINFQRIADVVQSVGVFSIGLMVAPIAPASFFEAQVEYCLHLQVRVFVDQEVTSFHVLSIPLNKRRRSDPTGATGVFEIAELALNAIITQWQDRMLAVVSDSDAIVTQEAEDPRLSLRNAVASRLESVAKPGFLRVCCAARQLNSLMQKVFNKLLSGDDLYSKLTVLLSYLSRQHALLSAMKTNIPRVTDNQWRSTAEVVMWFRRYGVSIREHLEGSKPICTPPDSWWIRVMLAARIGQEVVPLLDKISGFATETLAPREVVVRLRSFLADWFNVSGPLEIDDPAVAAAAARSRNDNSAMSRDGKYSVNTNDVFHALEDLGTFITDALRSAENEDEARQSVVKTTVKEIAIGVVNFVSGLASIITDIDGIGITLSELPAVLPHELVKLRGRQFNAIIRPQTDRLRSAGWTRQDIDWIEQDFQDLCSAYARESSVKFALDSCTSKSSFQDAWGCLQGRFTHLQRFCGLMATAHPIAAVDSISTSNSNLLASTTRATTLPGDIASGVSDLSVQAALQAKQFHRLQALRV